VGVGGHDSIEELVDVFLVCLFTVVVEAITFANVFVTDHRMHLLLHHSQSPLLPLRLREGHLQLLADPPEQREFHFDEGEYVVVVELADGEVVKVDGIDDAFVEELGGVGQLGEFLLAGAQGGVAGEFQRDYGEQVLREPLGVGQDQGDA
jgi:hypothetical protein